MRRKLLFGIGASLLALLVVAGIWGWPLMTSREARVLHAVKRGVDAVHTRHSPYRFDDPYLAYIYPGENLSCPLAGCTATYRLLDAYFSIRMVPYLYYDEWLRAEKDEADAVLTAMQPVVEPMPFSNTLAEHDDNGIALDTACIFGYLTNDTAIARHAVAALDKNKNWLADDLYTTDAWRNIADETWCIRLLASESSNAELVTALTGRKIVEMGQFSRGQASVIDKAAALVHMVYLLDGVQDDIAAGFEKQYAENLVAYLPDPAIVENTLMNANILDALLTVNVHMSGTVPTAAFSTLFDRLLARQHKDGTWTETAGDDGLPVFTTLRVLTALGRFSDVASLL